MSVVTKMSVDVSGFNQGINSAKTSLKTMDAALKQNEAQLKATGDKEAYLQQKTELLNTKMQIQKHVVNEMEKALKQMKDAGVNPASAEFQKMQQNLLNAQTSLVTTTADLNNLTQGEQAAAAGADQLSNSVSGISKKMSLEQVITGVNGIASGLENAAKKALELGKNLLNTALESASWADDTLTLAQVLGLDQDTVQRMNKVAATFEADASMIGSVWKKLRMNMTSDSAETVAAFEELGVATQDFIQGKYGAQSVGLRDFQDVFWEVGESLMKMAKDGVSAAEIERLAQKTLGRSWDELVPLFTKGRDAYEEALSSQTTTSEDAMTNLAALNDQYQQLLKDWNTLKGEALGSLAPALTAGAEALSKLLTSVTTYLQTEEGQALLERLGNAVSGLFDDLSNIDPEEVVSGFAQVFESIVTGVQWISDNSGAVVSALEAIVIGWGALKLTGGALEIVNLINGIRGLGAGASAASTAGAAAGTAWGGAFAKAVIAAAPWLAGLVTLLIPGSAGGGDDLDTLVDTSGNLTTAGKDAEYHPEGMKMTQKGYENRDFDTLLRSDEASVEVSKQQFDAIQKFWDVYRTRTDETDPDAWMAAFEDFESAFEGQDDLFDRVNQIMDHFSQTREESVWPEDLPEDFFKTVVDPVLPEDAQAQIQAELDQMSLGMVVQITPQLGGLFFGSQGGHANGLPFVPNDGWYQLHKGEEVVPAREVNNSRSFSSNLYVESMIMNNLTDAEGLAAAMAAAQRRTANGFGN